MKYIFLVLFLFSHQAIVGAENYYPLAEQGY